MPPDRLPAPAAVAALDAIVWTDPRVTHRDVVHAANVVLYRAAPVSVRAAWDRVIDRCAVFGPQGSPAAIRDEFDERQGTA